MTPGPADRTARAAARDAKLDATQEMLEAAVGALVTGDDWRRALEFTARFRTRSFNNTLLIYLQHLQAYEQGRVPDPTPTYVAGYHQWLALGRHVLKGQAGYVILAPVTARYANDDPERDAWRRLAPYERPGPGEALRSRVVGVKRAHVWDVSQTDGDPLPEPPMPVLLQGTAPDGLWDGLAARIVDAGFGLRRVPDATTMHGANGLTDYAAKVVSVRQDMGAAAQVKTLAHELGHVLLHGPDNPDAALHRGIAEVEAESVALMIGAAHGLDTTTYTVPYVASWASSVPGKSPIEVVKSTAERVRTTAASILDKLATAQVGNGEPPGLEAIRQAAAATPPRQGRSRDHRTTRSTVVTR
ncbi:ArdC-like ssDNA-binding domain-containing protein [Georgenia sp. AZ-5]|uniref:ArdC-like ssDNA-binding domain-containing protein n=1 Tax=Georgenia sp. AZ-5 TaxID=3367526 RepID=UPI003754AA20